ncbi:MULTISPECIES: neutral/alkaline non-lysosomal ceramidase N-terminal domain-containing protein [Emticicia]|uniref:neutral/alkaline non-lysosomal ceramidase N-terminal domain-containing protein n=1 Tax=Emticicia TaxID=312278 RepID=UPI0007D8BD83|nr:MULTISPECIES: neutral/alkaline non-lysosomal ceramidase N-terminal domain-containing protein [Emticicia]
MKTKVLLLFFLTFSYISFAQNNLKVGAAKIDITPELSELPSGFLGIYDRIHSRAIVIADQNKTVALVTLDVGAIPNEMAKSLLEKIATQTGIPTTNIMLTATHTHSVPFRIGGEAFEAKVVNSVKQAKDKLQPAKIGYGEGVSYINVNRNIIDPKTRRWWEGPNYDGPSDKTVAVVTFETLDGKPIAVHYNYAMHAVTVGMLDMVSGDAPGTTSKYIEDTFDDKIVAVWSTGACGDQNPIYFQQTYDLREIRIKEYASRGIDISNKMPPGGQGLNRDDPQVAKLMQQQKQMIVSMGQFLGEEVMHVMRGIERKESNVKIYANQKIVTCPGRKRLDEGRAGYAGTYEDADSIDIKLGLISINDIAFSSVGGEVFNPISTRLKRESPFAHTMMLTLTNGYAKSGYIPHDAAFGTYTFEVVSSRLKPGFAESAIVNGILDMMYESKQLQK